MEKCLFCIEQIRFGGNVYFEENGDIFCSKADDGKGFLNLLQLIKMCIHN